MPYRSSDTRISWFFPEPVRLLHMAQKCEAIVVGFCNPRECSQSQRSGCKLAVKNPFAGADAPLQSKTTAGLLPLPEGGPACASAARAGEISLRCWATQPAAGTGREA